MITEDRVRSAIECVFGRPLAETEMRFIRENYEAVAVELIRSLELKFDLIYEPFQKCLVNSDGRRFAGENLCDCIENYRRQYGTQKRGRTQRDQR